MLISRIVKVLAALMLAALIAGCVSDAETKPESTKSDSAASDKEIDFLPSRCDTYKKGLTDPVTETKRRKHKRYCSCRKKESSEVYNRQRSKALAAIMNELGQQPAFDFLDAYNTCADDAKQLHKPVRAIKDNFENLTISKQSVWSCIKEECEDQDILTECRSYLDSDFEVRRYLVEVFSFCP